jgi:hypothetical protein
VLAGLAADSQAPRRRGGDPPRRRARGGLTRQLLAFSASRCCAAPDPLNDVVEGWSACCAACSARTCAGDPLRRRAAASRGPAAGAGADEPRLNARDGCPRGDDPHRHRGRGRRRAAGDRGAPGTATAAWCAHRRRRTAGMDAARGARAFEPYSHDQGPRGRGTGLGPRHGARHRRAGRGAAVWLESAPGRGNHGGRSRSPRARRGPRAPRAPTRGRRGGAGAVPLATILLVEDEPAVRALTSACSRARATRGVRVPTGGRRSRAGWRSGGARAAGTSSSATS